MEKKARAGRIIMVLALFLVLAGIAACEDSGYKTMSIKEGIQGFKFEYPNNYRLIRLNLENVPEAKYTDIGLSADDGQNFSEIYVYVWLPNSDLSSARQIMDKLLGNASTTMTDFVLISNSSTVFGDTVAQQAVFTADSHDQVPGDSTGDGSIEGSDGVQPVPRPATFRVTTMIYAGLAVEIDLTCDQSITEATADDYQHVLDTFTIAD